MYRFKCVLNFILFQTEVSRHCEYVIVVFDIALPSVIAAKYVCMLQLLASVLVKRASSGGTIFEILLFACQLCMLCHHNANVSNSSSLSSNRQLTTVHIYSQTGRTARLFGTITSGNDFTEKYERLSANLYHRLSISSNLDAQYSPLVPRLFRSSYLTDSNIFEETQDTR